MQTIGQWSLVELKKVSEIFLLALKIKKSLIPQLLNGIRLYIFYSVTGFFKIPSNTAETIAPITTARR
jgi:hypothetical protein